MSVAEGPAYIGEFPIAAEAVAAERAQFIRKTYVHLTGAVLSFVLLLGLLVNTPLATSMVGLMTSRLGWLITLGAFILVSTVAEKWARTATSLPKQYAGLSLYVAAEAVIFVPMVWMASRIENVVPVAALTTLVLFIGLSVIVFVTGKDFSFLRGALSIAGLAAMGFIVLGMIFGFTLGIGFTVAMIAFACGYILYDTSNVLHHFRLGQHVAASLALFASVALLFWYVLRLLMSRR